MTEIEHNGQLGSYRSVKGSTNAHEIVLFEQVCTHAYAWR
jgi:hypothetical protein